MDDHGKINFGCSQWVMQRQRLQPEPRAARLGRRPSQRYWERSRQRDTRDWSRVLCLISSTDRQEPCGERSRAGSAAESWEGPIPTRLQCRSSSKKKPSAPLQVLHRSHHFSRRERTEGVQESCLPGEMGKGGQDLAAPGPQG